MTNEEKAFIGAIGERVRLLRLERGWTQLELGARCGMDATQIRRIEKGQNPTALTLYRIAQALKIEVRELLQVVD